MKRELPGFWRRWDRSFSGDLTALYLVQGATLILPLATLPYLARVLGPHAWGVVVISQSFALWLSLFIEYGFSIAATRDLAHARGDRARVASITSGVQSARAFLAVAACIVAAPLAWLAPAFREQPLLLILTCCAAVAQGLYPYWYFQGVGRVREAVYVDVCLRIVGVAGIFLLVHRPADAPLVLALQVITQSTTTLVTTRRMRRDVPRRAATRDELHSTLKRAAPLMIFRLSAGLYATINAFLLGLFIPASMVAMYGAAERIARSGLAALDPFAQAVFPRLSYWFTRDRHTADSLHTRTAQLMVAGGVGIAILIAALAEPIIRLLLGPGYESAVPLLRMLVVIVPLVAASNALGIQWMVPRGLDRPFAVIVSGAAGLNLVLASWLAPRLGAPGMAASVLATELAVTLAMAVVVTRVNRRRRTAAILSATP